MNAYFLHWLLASAAIAITAAIVPGFRVSNFFAALLASVVVGLVNIVVWPILLLLTLPLTILTFGLFLFVVNGLALKVAAALTPGFTIEGLWPAILGSIVLTLVGWLIRFVIYGH
jgi:putative membrane protein